jgi:hypothetical protein
VLALILLLLLVGIVIEGEAEEVEVDTSLRGRLNSLVEKVKTLRKKKEEEEEPEVKEETKPGKIKLTLQANCQDNCV